MLNTPLYIPLEYKGTIVYYYNTSVLVKTNTSFHLLTTLSQRPVNLNNLQTMFFRANWIYICTERKVCSDCLMQQRN